MQALHLQFQRSLLVACVLGTLALSTDANGADDYDFSWAVIDRPNNPGYSGPVNPNRPITGRGAVAYTYRISKLEVTTGQWMEFANVMAALDEPYRIGEGPVGGYELNFSGSGPRYVLRSVPNDERLPVTGISWYNAARYCNWLHNGKPDTLESLTTGAYDTTTFQPSGPAPRTDAVSHLPGAKYWIPTLDEWIKAVHYDPNRYGPDHGGYWQSPNGTDTPLVSGDAGAGGQTNAGMPFLPVSSLLLGAYSNVQTPWGLLDASGGAGEWLEDPSDSDRTSRRHDGRSYRDVSMAGAELDLVYRQGGESPETGIYIGLRIASQIPAPSTGAAIGFVFTLFTRRHRRFAQRAS